MGGRGRHRRAGRRVGGACPGARGGRGPAPGPEGRFRSDRHHAIRYAEAFLASGTTLSAIAEAARRGQLFFDTVGSLYPPVPHTDVTLLAIADRSGMGVPALQTILTALGLPTPRPADRLRADDARLLDLILGTWAGGRETVDGGPAIRAALGYGTAMRRLVELEHGLYFETVNPELRGVVTDGTERHRLTTDAAEALAAAGQIVALLHARLMEQQIARTSVEVTEAFLGTQGILARVDPTGWSVVGFVDVSGYTRLSQEQGDERAAAVAATFAELVQLEVQSAGGRLVKLLGDGALLLFRDVDLMLRTISRLFRAAADAGLPALHAGVHTGPVIERDADVFGRTVNLASRISGRAAAGEVLVSDAVATQLDPGRWPSAPTGDVTLKGLPDPVRLHRVRLEREGSSGPDGITG
ncbi:MAG: adenylate/guanylate cyclase domain-containing protein [Chloroflexota bacterium]